MSLGATRSRVLAGDTIDLAPDNVLESIVHDAAVELGAPWACVNLLLDRTLLIRAHHRLPMKLAVLRSMESDGAFCERVVLERAIVEVVDALADPIAKVQYDRHGVRSYLGVPLYVAGVCVGSLCILDREPRHYDEAAREQLIALGSRASLRLAQLAARPKLRRGMTEVALRSPLAELGNRLTPLLGRSEVARRALDDLVAEQGSQGDVVSDALRRVESAIQGIEEEVGYVWSTLASLQTMLVGSANTGITELAQIAEELAYHHTKLVGGVRWQMRSAMPLLDVSNRIAVTVLASALSLLAMDMNKTGTRSGIDAGIVHRSGQLLVTLTADIGADQIRASAATVADIVDERGIDVEAMHGALRITLPSA